jgi:hypothetical protein
VNQEMKNSKNVQQQNISASQSDDNMGEMGLAGTTFYS